MPSLNVAWVAAMNSRSSISSRRWKVSMGGMVASPTPTVAMSSDSISVMSSTLPSVLDNAAAADQPAVPPPAMTTRRTGWRAPCLFIPVWFIGFCTGRSLAFHAIQYLRAQLARLILGQRHGQAAARIGRNVRHLVHVGVEHVVI